MDLAGAAAGFFSWFRGIFLPTANPNTAQDTKLRRTARLNDIREAWRAYYGLMENPLRVKMGQPDDNIKLNFGKIVVDKNISFLFGGDVCFHVEEPREDTTQESQKDPRQELLDACWEWNHKQTLLHNIGLNGSVTGHCFVKIKLDAGLPYPRLINLDPGLVEPECDPEDFERVLRYVITWNPDSTAKVQKRQVIEPVGGLDAVGNIVNGWVILDQVSTDSGENWQEEARVSWPYRFAPIFHCQNWPVPNQFFGLSDLPPDIRKLLHSRNFIASNTARIIRFHAHPKTYASGLNAKTDRLEMGVDDIVFLPRPEAKLGTLEMKGDGNFSLGFLMYLDENLMSLASIPPIALGRMEANGQMSGVALRIRYQPLIQRICTKQHLYGDMLDALNSALLEIMGHPGLTCETSWPDPLPSNMPEKTETGVLLEQLGVSKQTIITDLGYDWEEEKARKAEEAAAAQMTAQTAFDRGNVPPQGNVPTTTPGGLS